MSAPHPRYQDDAPSPNRVLAAFAPLESVGKRLEIELIVDHPANRLADLATLLRQLTWGEMDEFSSAINANPKTVHQWSLKDE